MQKHWKRLAVLIVVGMMSVGLLAPAASAQSCAARVVEAELAELGTDRGQFVAFAASNPEIVGLSSLGELVSFLATTDDCPVA